MSLLERSENMILSDVISSLNKQFISRYGKQFAELNKNVYPTALNDRGAYQVPVPIVGQLGGTLMIGCGAFDLNPPAPVSVQFKNMKPQQFVYRVAVPYTEAEIAADKKEYFNYLFDAIMSKAIGNYQATVGKADVVRFGTTFCSCELPESTPNNKVVFRQLDNMDLEFRLYGSWASTEEDNT
jgi:hypothetical protein